MSSIEFKTSIENYIISIEFNFQTRHSWIGSVSHSSRLAISGWDIKHTVRSGMPKVLQQAEVYVINETNSDCSLSNNQHSMQLCAGSYENDGGNFSNV